MSEERWTLFNVRRGNFKCFWIQKSIQNAYFFSFTWFFIYLITTPAVFLNQTHLVKLGIFHLELGKKHTFWLWEFGPKFRRSRALDSLEPLHPLIFNFICCMIRHQGFRIVKFSRVENSRWPPLLKIAKTNKIVIFSRTARYIWLKFCMKY